MKSDNFRAAPQSSKREPIENATKASFWNHVHGIETKFHSSLEQHELRETTAALLELDRIIWKAQHDRESPEFISQAREILRELIVAIGVKLHSAPASRTDCFEPLVEALLALRQEFRTKKQFDTADAVRQSLESVGIVIEDAAEGSRWRLNPP